LTPRPAASTHAGATVSVGCVLPPSLVTFRLRLSLTAAGCRTRSSSWGACGSSRRRREAPTRSSRFVVGQLPQVSSLLPCHVAHHGSCTASNKAATSTACLPPDRSLQQAGQPTLPACWLAGPRLFVPLLHMLDTHVASCQATPLSPIISFPLMYNSCPGRVLRPARHDQLQRVPPAPKGRRHLKVLAHVLPPVHQAEPG
jgi:hypothetical protein